MADDELQIEEPGKKSKLPLIIILAVVIIAAGAGTWFFVFSDDPAAAPPAAEAGTASAAPAATPGNASVGSALYVAMPRPFTFNVPGSGRDRLVEIKVQLMVRGADNEETAKMHIPLIEGTLLQVFSASSADDLVTEAGKVALREKSVTKVQEVLKDIAGAQVVEQVLFTGFVMQ